MKQFFFKRSFRKYLKSKFCLNFAALLMLTCLLYSFLLSFHIVFSILLLTIGLIAQSFHIFCTNYHKIATMHFQNFREISTVVFSLAIKYFSNSSFSSANQGGSKIGEVVKKSIHILFLKRSLSFWLSINYGRCVGCCFVRFYGARTDQNILNIFIRLSLFR